KGGFLERAFRSGLVVRWVPVPLQPSSGARLLDEARARGDGGHGLVGCLVRRQPQPSGDFGEEGQVEIVRTIGMGDYARLRGGDDQRPTQIRVEQRPGSGEVARAEDPALLPISEDEGVVDVDVLRAL